jgi:hypothetical protein
VEFTFLPQGVWKYERVPWEKKGSSWLVQEERDKCLLASSQRAFSSSVTFHICLPVRIEPARIYVYTHTHTYQFANLATPISSLYVINIYLRPSDLCYNAKLKRNDIAYLTLFSKLSSQHCKCCISCFSSHSILQTIIKVQLVT